MSAPQTTPGARAATTTDRAAILIASFGMIGFFPVAPATLASAVTAVLLYFVLPWSPVAWGIGIAVLLALGVWSSGRLERLLGTDPSAAVIDEVLGMLLSMLAAPITPTTLVLGFLLFRIFDVLKVWPGRRLERLHGGWGIMMDDVLAGLYAALVLQGILRVWPDPHFGPLHWILGGIAALVLLGFRKPLLARFGKKRSSVSAAFGKKIR